MGAREEWVDRVRAKNKARDMLKYTPSKAKQLVIVNHL